REAQKGTMIATCDALERGSKTSFGQILSELQRLDISVYFVQAPDRTRGAIRRDVPKPKQVIEKLVEGTGGLTFPIDQPREAANAIWDEMRNSRYIMSYMRSATPLGETCRWLVLCRTG